MIVINLENNFLNDKIMLQETFSLISAYKPHNQKKPIKSHSSGLLSSITYRQSVLMREKRIESAFEILTSFVFLSTLPTILEDGRLPQDLSLSSSFLV